MNGQKMIPEGKQPSRIGAIDENVSLRPINRSDHNYSSTAGNGTSSVGLFRILSRPTATALAAVLLGVAFAFPSSGQASANGDWEPETVYMGIVSAGDPRQTAPEPAPGGSLNVEISEADAEILARLLWSSPLTNEDDKRRLCWLVFNRIDDERFGLFGSTVYTVVIRREFEWYDRKSYISDTNIRIAREELRRWKLYLIGAVKERLLPAEYVFASFEGRHICFYSEIGGTAWTE